MKTKLKSRTTSTGSSEIHVNDVGNPSLHAKHKVGIVKFDKGNNGRAVVFDQHLIDALYLRHDLNAEQHNVCNKYLSMLMKGMHLSAPSYEERSSTGKYYMAPLPRCCVLLKVQRHIRKLCGRKSESRFWILMSNSPKKIRLDDVKLVQDCAEALLFFYYVTEDSPVALFQQALASHA